MPLKENEKTETEVIQDVLSGDGAAFAALVERYVGGIYSFAYSYVRDAAEAEDIAQETFIRAWKHLKKFDLEKNFKTWLFAIAKNAALDSIKKKRPLFFSRMAESDDELSSLLAAYVEEGVPPERAIDRMIAAAGLDKEIEKLPPIYQTVLALRYHENLKFAEIARALGEPIDTVKSRHRRGLIMLREAFH